MMDVCMMDTSIRHLDYGSCQITTVVNALRCTIVIGNCRDSDSTVIRMPAGCGHHGYILYLGSFFEMKGIG